jgi:hypothetical protein
MLAVFFAVTKIGVGRLHASHCARHSFAAAAASAALSAIVVRPGDFSGRACTGITYAPLKVHRGDAASHSEALPSEVDESTSADRVVLWSRRLNSEEGRGDGDEHRSDAQRCQAQQRAERRAGKHVRRVVQAQNHP